MAKAIRWWSVALILTLIAYGVRFWFQPVAVVVPHHNIVAGIRRELLSFVASRRAVTSKIILISPDHFSFNQHKILTPLLDSAALDADHGITNVYADLAKLWPNARIDAFIIGNKVTVNQLKSLLGSIQQLCDSDCLLVASVDFSHYLPRSQALYHDRFTLSALSRQRADSLLVSDVDSPQSLWLMSEFAKNRQASLWRLSDHTISGGNETTSHVFGWYQRGVHYSYEPY